MCKASGTLAAVTRVPRQRDGFYLHFLPMILVGGGRSHYRTTLGDFSRDFDIVDGSPAHLCLTQTLESRGTKGVSPIFMCKVTYLSHCLSTGK